MRPRVFLNGKWLWGVAIAGREIATFYSHVDAFVWAHDLAIRLGTGRTSEHAYSAIVRGDIPESRDHSCVLWPLGVTTCLDLGIHGETGAGGNAG